MSFELEGSLNALALFGVLRAEEEFEAAFFFEAARGQVVVKPHLGVATGKISSPTIGGQHDNERALIILEDLDLLLWQA